MKPIQWGNKGKARSAGGQGIAVLKPMNGNGGGRQKGENQEMKFKEEEGKIKTHGSALT